MCSLSSTCLVLNITYTFCSIIHAFLCLLGSITLLHTTIPFSWRSRAGAREVAGRDWSESRIYDYTNTYNYTKVSTNAICKAITASVYKKNRQTNCPERKCGQSTVKMNAVRDNATSATHRQNRWPGQLCINKSRRPRRDSCITAIHTYIRILRICIKRGDETTPSWRSALGASGQDERGT